MDLIRRLGAAIRRLLFPERSIVVPPPPPFDDKSVYITVARAREIITNTLGKKISSNVHIHLADMVYYCPSVEYVNYLLSQDDTDRMKYTKEVFDCDDYSWLLKGRFCLDAYKDGKRRASHAAGIVWGMLPLPHAMFWVITDDLELRLIEPQTDAWKEWGDSFKIWLMAA